MMKVISINDDGVTTHEHDALGHLHLPRKAKKQVLTCYNASMRLAGRKTQQRKHGRYTAPPEKD